MKHCCIWRTIAQLSICIQYITHFSTNVIFANQPPNRTTITHLVHCKCSQLSVGLEMYPNLCWYNFISWAEWTHQQQHNKIDTISGWTHLANYSKITNNEFIFSTFIPGPPSACRTWYWYCTDFLLFRSLSSFIQLSLLQSIRSISIFHLVQWMECR